MDRFPDGFFDARCCCRQNLLQVVWGDDVYVVCSEALRQATVQDWYGVSPPVLQSTDFTNTFIPNDRLPFHPHHEANTEWENRAWYLEHTTPQHTLSSLDHGKPNQKNHWPQMCMATERTTVVRNAL